MIIPINEVRKEDDLYFIGPFWVIGQSLTEINSNNFEVISEKFLIDWDGKFINPVPPLQYTHRGIWESKYKSKYNNVDFDYYPRGRISFNHRNKEFCINIPKGLNNDLILPKILNDYGLSNFDVKVKYTDPTSGNHYTFKLK